MLTDELLIYVFDGQSHLLAPPMATWLASSRRFTAFVTTFRDKIRKKLRATQDQESLLDLRLELETAYLLLQERPLSLVYEPEQSGQVRCPDFAVTFTTSLTFMVEVTRLRADPNSTLAEAQERTLATPAPNTILTIPLIGERLADTICSKLGQLLPQRSHVLLVGVELDIAGAKYVFGTIDGTVVAAILTPTLGAYVTRRYTDRKYHKPVKNEEKKD